MKIDAIKNVDFGCSFDIQTTEYKDWVRMFVIDSKERVIGRLNFYRGEFYNIKNYKRHYIDTLDETDLIFMRIAKYMESNVLLSLKEYNTFVEEASTIQRQDYEKKLKWRRENFLKKKRKRLQHKNIRNILEDLIRRK